MTTTSRSWAPFSWHRGPRAPLVSVALLLPTLLACGAPQVGTPASTIDGHYEGTTADDMHRFDGGQVVLPEYAHVEAVLVSHQLVRAYDHGAFLKAMLATGLRTLYVAMPPLNSFSGSTGRTRVLDALGEYKERVTFIDMPAGAPDKPTVWARDWAPLMAHATDGSGPRLLDFNYYPRRPVDDAVPTGLATSFPGLARVSVPVYNEGGNFMINGRGECLMSTRVTDANATKAKPEDMLLDEAAVKDFYGRFAGCKKTTLLPRMPMEGTGHIDMWAKFLTDDDVIVGHITKERIERFAGEGVVREVADVLSQYLDARASDLAAAGYRVHRIPMPLPRFDVFRSYTNSLLVNGTAFVPRYGAIGAAANGEAWREEYEPEVAETYRKFGFTVEFVDSDSLIRDGGAVHCVTMQFHATP